VGAAGCPVSGCCRVPRARYGWSLSAGCDGLVGGQPGCSRFRAVSSRSAQGVWVDSRSRVGRAWRAMRAAIENRRSRGRLGSQRRAGWLCRAGICSQAVSSMASWTMAHQIRLWSKPCSGRLARPVSLAVRMRSSQRARRRCRSSRSGSCPRAVLVANAVSRSPSVSVNRSCAPGWGRFFAHDDPHALGPPGQIEQAGGLGDPRPDA
jgi:hypothetical protein